jgi:hypothetical protein
LAAHDQEWGGRLLELAGEVKYRRGFVEEIAVSAITFIDRVDELFRFAPLRHVRLTEVWEHVPALATAPVPTSLQTLDLSCNHLDNDAVKVLAASKHLNELARLNLMYNEIRDAGAGYLAASQYLGRLTSLNVGGNPIWGAGREVLQHRFQKHVSFSCKRGADSVYPMYPQGAHGWFTGTAADGRQVLFVEEVERVFAIFFDEEGTFLGEESRLFSPRSHWKSDWAPLAEEILSAWQLEIGFQHQAIFVKKFVLGTEDGIADAPSHILDMSANPDSYSDEEREGFFAFLRDSWGPDEQFVFHLWENDYWLDKTGEVVAS